MTEGVSDEKRRLLVYVLKKLRQLSINGYDFGDEPYLFDWDSKKSKDINLENIVKEHAILKHLNQQGVIKLSEQDNYYRTQQLESWADPNRRHIIWGGWEDFNPQLREYEWMVYIDNINPKKYKQQLDNLGLIDEGVEIKASSERKENYYKKPHFDLALGRLFIGNKFIEVNPGTYQYYICKHAIRQYGKEPAKEVDILDDYSASEVGLQNRSIRDATTALNKKSSKTFGLKNLFVYKSGNVSVNHSLFVNS